MTALSFNAWASLKKTSQPLLTANLANPANPSCSGASGLAGLAALAVSRGRPDFLQVSVEEATGRPATMADNATTAIATIPPLGAPWPAGVAYMQVMPIPLGFTNVRWRRACLDAAALLDTHGTELLALGWSATDVFGLHAEVPGVAVDCYGLALLLDGATVTELTATSARIIRPTGSTLRMQRGGGRPAVPAWLVGEQGHGC